MRNYGWVPDGSRLDAAGQFVVDCPVCDRKNKFRYNPRSKKGLCFSSMCGVRADTEEGVKQLFNAVGATPAIAVRPIVTDLQTLEPLITRELTGSVCAWDYEVSRKFLSEERSLTEEVVRKVPIGGDGNRMWIPVDPIRSGYKPIVLERNADGSGKWMPARSGMHPRQYCFGVSAWLDSGRSQLILCEGAFDVLSSGLYGAAVAVLGSSFPEDMSAYLNRLGQDDPDIECFYWPDDDPAGEVGANKAVKSLRSWGIPCKIVRNGKDPKKTSPINAATFLKNNGWKG